MSSDPAEMIRRAKAARADANLALDIAIAVEHDIFNASRVPPVGSAVRKALRADWVLADYGLDKAIELLKRANWRMAEVNAYVAGLDAQDPRLAAGYGVGHRV